MKGRQRGQICVVSPIWTQSSVCRANSKGTAFSERARVMSCTRGADPTRGLVCGGKSRGPIGIFGQALRKSPMVLGRFPYQHRVGLPIVPLVRQSHSEPVRTSCAKSKPTQTQSTDRPCLASGAADCRVRPRTDLSEMGASRSPKISRTARLSQ